MGAFYHVKNKARRKAMQKCLRVLKKNGLLIISYINNMAVTIMSLQEKLSNMNCVLEYYKSKTKDRIFFHMTPDEIEAMAKEYGTKIISHIATDGIQYLLADRINSPFIWLGLS